VRGRLDQAGTLARPRPGGFFPCLVVGSGMSQHADYASTPYKHRNPMRRHFCITLWLDAEGTRLEDESGVVDAEPWVASIIDTARLLRAHYCAWGLEDTAHGGGGEPPSDADASNEDGEGADAGLHLHAYIECERTVRWSTVRNRFQTAFSGAHVEARRGWRSSAREYALGLLHGVPKPSAITAGEWGQWRDDAPDQLPDDLAAEAAAVILQGGTPKEVARRWPRWFLRHGGGVIRLWETLHHRRLLR